MVIEEKNIFRYSFFLGLVTYFYVPLTYFYINESRQYGFFIYAPRLLIDEFDKVTFILVSLFLFFLAGRKFFSPKVQKHVNESHSLTLNQLLIIFLIVIIFFASVASVMIGPSFSNMFASRGTSIFGFASLFIFSFVYFGFAGIIDSSGSSPRASLIKNLMVFLFASIFILDFIYFSASRRGVVLPFLFFIIPLYLFDRNGNCFKMSKALAVFFLVLLVILMLSVVSLRKEGGDIEFLEETVLLALDAPVVFEATARILHDSSFSAIGQCNSYLELLLFTSLPAFSEYNCQPVSMYTADRYFGIYHSSFNPGLIGEIALNIGIIYFPLFLFIFGFFVLFLARFSRGICFNLIISLFIFNMSRGYTHEIFISLIIGIPVYLFCFLQFNSRN